MCYILYVHYENNNLGYYEMDTFSDLKCFLENEFYNAEGDYDDENDRPERVEGANFLLFDRAKYPYNSPYFHSSLEFHLFCEGFEQSTRIQRAESEEELPDDYYDCL